MRGHLDTQNGTMKIHFGIAKTELSFSLLKCLSLWSTPISWLVRPNSWLLAPSLGRFEFTFLLTMKWLQVLEAAILPVLVNAVASTDEYSDAVRTLLPCPPIFYD